jgi:hypothetical protein
VFGGGREAMRGDGRWEMSDHSEGLLPVPSLLLRLYMSRETTKHQYACYVDVYNIYLV